jgi:hypothetical protein
MGVKLQTDPPCRGLPVTSNGKLDSHALPLPDHSEAADRVVPPLLGTQLLSRIQAEFSVQMPLRELFVFPTLAEMAERIEDLVLASSNGQDLDELLDLLDNLDEDAAAEGFDLARSVSGDLDGGAL